MGLEKTEVFLRNGLGNGFQFSSGIKKTEGGIQKEEGIKISATVIPEPLGPTEGPPVDELFGPLGFAALPSFLFLLSVTIKAEEQIRLKRQSLEQRK